MKKTILKDDNGKSLEVDLKEFNDHLNEFHRTGISTHTQSGCSFTVDDKFRIKIKKLYEKWVCWMKNSLKIITIMDLSLL